MTRPFTLAAAIIFALMALVHVYRAMTHFQLIVGSHVIPDGVSWIGALAAAILAIGLFREAFR